MVRLSQLLDTMLIYVCPQPVLSSRLLHMLLYYKNINFNLKLVSNTSAYYHHTKT